MTRTDANAVALIHTARLVLVDAAGTLFHPRAAMGSLIREAAAAAGLDLPADRLETVFRACWAEERREHPLSGPTTPREDRARWDRLGRAVLDRAGSGQIDGGWIGGGDTTAFLDGFFAIHGDSDHWRLFPGVAEALVRLADGGRRLAVVSNWDSRLFGLLRGFGLADRFDLVIASAPFGVAKPDAAIFRAALSHFGAVPADAVVVGDSLEDDVHGAGACGIPAVWFHPAPPAGQADGGGMVPVLTGWNGLGTR
ncbi:HAD-IA family hydrolase [Azospirillum sp. B506]|uniref:HAD-IA family hydrolase n=1 Tax=Azospirillum sp. B506 TaxID=137721 RepID=UPI000348E507|nr:HAD-IA family hydrolase [Azospirillum sp. B506]